MFDFLQRSKICSDTEPVVCKFLFFFFFLVEVNRKRILAFWVVVGREGLSSLAEGGFCLLVSAEAQTQPQSLGECVLTFW